MKTQLLALAFFVGSAAVAQENPQRPVPLSQSALSVDRISLQGIAMMGSERYAALSLRPGSGGWIKAGQKVGRFTIVAVDENSVKLVDSETHTEFTKQLGEGTVKSADKAEGPARYSRAWINSKANPMLYHAISLPSNTAMNWSKLPEKQREDIIAYYRQHGWQLRYTETNDGITSGFAWDNVYTEARVAVMKANDKAFEASLNDAQRSKWQEIHAAPAFRFDGPAPTPEVFAEIQRRKDNVAAFRAALSPEQLAAYDARGDFTKHDWTKE